MFHLCVSARSRSSRFSLAVSMPQHGRLGVGTEPRVHYTNSTTSTVLYHHLYECTRTITQHCLINHLSLWCKDGVNKCLTFNPKATSRTKVHSSMQMTLGYTPLKLVKGVLGPLVRWRVWYVLSINAATNCLPSKKEAIQTFAHSLSANTHHLLTDSCLN